MPYTFSPSDSELQSINDKLDQIKSDSAIESKINKRRFVIQTIISVLGLIAAVVAAVVSIIAL